MANVVIISSTDNVGVVIEWIKEDEELSYLADGKLNKFTAKNDIRIYHKVAIKEIKKGENVVKYGEHIGIANRDIQIGEHVHVHNVDDHREDLSSAE